MRIALMLSFLFVACGAPQNSNLFQDKDPPKLTDKQKAEANENLALLFEDPINGEGATNGFNEYFEYKKKDLELRKKLSLDLSAADKIVVRSELKILGREYDLFGDPGYKIRKALGELGRFISLMKKDESAPQKLEAHNKEKFDTWQKEREKLIKALEDTTGDSIKRGFVAQEFRRIETFYQLQFLGHWISIN